MTYKKIKWDFKTTEKLILLRHEPATHERFLAAKNNPKALKKEWQELAMHFGENCSPQIVKTKYNNLLSTYRTIVSGHKKSGTQRNHWLYFEIFNSSIIDKGGEIVPQNYIECGDYTITEQPTENYEEFNFSLDKIKSSEQLIKKEKQKSSSNVKHRILELILNKLEDEKVEKEEKEKEFVKVEEFNKQLANINNKLDVIMDFLNKN